MPGAPRDFDIRHVASLARLTLSPDEEAAFSRQLPRILAFADQVRSVDTSGTPPTTHVIVPAMSERNDQATPSLPPDRALANAPEAERGLFRVPRVVG